jgi:hypothetical protein
VSPMSGMRLSAAHRAERRSAGPGSYQQPPSLVVFRIHSAGCARPRVCLPAHPRTIRTPNRSRAPTLLEGSRSIIFFLLSLHLLLVRAPSRFRSLPLSDRSHTPFPGLRSSPPPRPAAAILWHSCRAVAGGKACIPRRSHQRRNVPSITPSPVASTQSARTMESLSVSGCAGREAYRQNAGATGDEGRVPGPFCSRPTPDESHPRI